MDKRRKEEDPRGKSDHQSPEYLDSAYKLLLRQDLKVSALKNRTKLLNINH